MSLFSTLYMLRARDLVGMHGHCGGTELFCCHFVDVVWADLVVWDLYDVFVSRWSFVIVSGQLMAVSIGLLDLAPQILRGKKRPWWWFEFKGPRPPSPLNIEAS